MACFKHSKKLPEINFKNFSLDRNIFLNSWSLRFRVNSESFKGDFGVSNRLEWYRKLHHVHFLNRHLSFCSWWHKPVWLYGLFRKVVATNFLTEWYLGTNWKLGRIISYRWSKQFVNFGCCIKCCHFISKNWLLFGIQNCAGFHSNIFRKNLCEHFLGLLFSFDHHFQGLEEII